MNGNPFYIEPANFMQGLNAIGEGLETRAGYMREKAKKREAEELQLKAKDVLTKGTSDEIAEFVAMNPDYAKAADTIVKPKSEKTKRDMAETSIMILNDPENAVNYLTKRADMLVEEGADASGTLAMLKAATEGKKDLVSRLAENGLAYSSPEMFKAYKEQAGMGKESSKNLSQMRNDYDKAVSEGYAGKFVDYVREIKNAERAPVVPQKPKDTRTTNERDFDRAVNDPKYAAWLARKDDAKRTALVERQKFSNTSGLRKEFVAQSKDFQEVRSAKTRLDASAKNPSPAGDLAVIFNYMKMLDPGSVVRESEFAVAAKAGSYGERIQAAAGRVLSGKRLSPEMRKDFLTKANDLYSASLKQHEKRKKSYERIAKKNNLPVDEVLVDVESFSDVPEPKSAQTGKGTPERLVYNPKTGGFE